MKILITSGGTKVPIDRVRSITNMSKGTFGSKIADEFWDVGLSRKLDNCDGEDVEQIEKITFFMAKGSKQPQCQRNDLEAYGSGAYTPIEYVEYSTFDEYNEGIEKLLSEEKYDIIVVAAAVSDYGVANYYNGKYRSREDDMCIKLVKLPKILPIMRELAPDAVICGFKLLVDSTYEELIKAMEKQIDETNVDLVVGNDLRDIKADDHQLFIMRNDRPEPAELGYVYHEYKQPPKDKRTPFTMNCLAKAVVNECIEAYERKSHTK